MDVIQQLIGRLHPMVVHLPIGFIITGLLLQWIDRKQGTLKPVIAKVFLWGFIAAIVASISGYLLYLNEGYGFNTIKFHLWAGIATALFSGLMYYRIKAPTTVEFLSRIPTSLFSYSLLFLISITGHLGGSITHGSDYLVEPLPTAIKTALGIAPKNYELPRLEEALWEESDLYAQVVQPILNNRCLSCHNPKKSKGDLHLNNPEGILNGGENGEVIKSHDIKNSPLYARLVLPIDHEDHMPPKEKSQLSKEEIEVIKAWIETGPSFDKTIGELKLPKSLFTAFFPKDRATDYPELEVAAIPTDTIRLIRSYGFHIEPISASSNLIRVSCINKPDFIDADLKLLSSLSKQLVNLDVSNTQVTDAIFESLTKFPNLTVLKLNHTQITGENIDKLQSLDYLKTLHLTHTNFSGKHLSSLNSFKALKSVFLYNSKVDPTEFQNPPTSSDLRIDYGNYQLPKIAADTIVY